MPTLVTLAQLPGGSLALMEDELPSKCKVEIEIVNLDETPSVREEIYSIPACLPTHPRYCLIVGRRLGQRQNIWDIFEVEIDLSMPGPIKGIREVSQSSIAVSRGTHLYHCSDDHMVLILPSVHGTIPHAPLSIRFLRVGTLGDWRAVKVGGMDKMCVSGLHVDRHAGYIMAWVKEGRFQWARECAFIWWIDERNQDMVWHSWVRDLVSSWSRRLLRGL